MASGTAQMTDWIVLMDFAAEGLFYEQQNLPRASGMKNDLFTSLSTERISHKVIIGRIIKGSTYYYKVVECSE